MSYTPDDQIMGPVLRIAVGSLDDVVERIDNRVKAQSDWKPDHIDDLLRLRGKIIKLRRKLATLEEETR